MAAPTWLTTLVILAGVGQLVLILGSLAIPRQLGWREKLAATTPLTRQMFLVYAGYIWATNLSFGLVSALASGWLLDGSPLGTAVCGFMFVYWLARVIVQWTYFDLSEIELTGFNRVARWLLEPFFVAVTVVYGIATVRGLSSIYAWA